MSGVPGKPLPEGWDEIPGARGCTPQTCGFRDHHAGLTEFGVEVFGLSTQPTEYQRQMVERLHVPFDVLSDSEFRFCDALRLPTFEVEGMRLVKRLTLVIRNGAIEHVFYPVFPPNESAGQVIQWLRREIRCESKLTDKRRSLAPKRFQPVRATGRGHSPRPVWF